MIDILVQDVQADGTVRFRFRPHPTIASGISRLTQLVSKVLLTRAGTDVFFKQLGAGVDTLLPMVVGVNARGLQQKAGAIVGDTESQIQAIQSGQRLPADERLRSLILRSATYDGTTNAIKLDIDVISDATVRRVGLTV